jgi:hypothetical protein
MGLMGEDPALVAICAFRQPNLTITHCTSSPQRATEIGPDTAKIFVKLTPAK